LAIVGEDVAVSIHDGVLGSVLSYGSKCSCQCVVSRLSICFLGLLFEGNMVIVGENIMVGAFVVIAVNTMMGLFGVVVSALAGTEVSALLTCVWGLRYWMSYITSRCIDACYSEWYGQK